MDLRIKSLFLFLFSLIFIVVNSQSNNNELFKQLAHSNKTQSATLFIQMSKNALNYSPRQALAYSIAAERFVLNDDTLKINTYIAQSEAYVQLGEYQDVINIVQKALIIKGVELNFRKAKLLCIIGQANKELGNYEKAQHFYESALALYSSGNNLKFKAQVFQLLGGLWFRQNKLVEAQDAYYKAYQVNIERNDSNAIANTLVSQALLERQKGDYNAAFTKLDQGFQYAQNQSNEIKASLFNLRGSIYFLQRNFQSSLSDFETALDLRKKSDNPMDIASILLNISNVYKETNQYRKGIQVLNKALYLKIRLADTVQVVSIYNALGGFNLRFNKYDNALLHYLRALQLSYHEGYTNELGPLLMNIGTLYYELNDTKKADEYLNKAVKLMVIPRDNSKLALLYTHLGNNARKALNYKEAIEYYQKALSEKNQLNDKVGASAVLLNIGAAYQESKNFNQALTYTHKALSIQKEIQNIQGEANTLNQLGNIYNDMLKKQEALLYFKLARKLAVTNKLLFIEGLSARKEAEIELLNNRLASVSTLLNRSISIGKELSNPELIRKGQLVFHDLYIKLNNYQAALSAYKQYAQYTDSLNKQQNQKQIMQMQMNFEIARRDSRITEAEDKIENLNKEKEKRNYELKVQRNLQMLWIAIIILLLISAISLIRGYRLKKKAAILLEEKFELSEESNQKLRKSEEELRTLNNTKDKFFSIIAHDLKNPLGGLVSITELMTTNYEQLEDASKKEMIILINQSSKQLNTLLGNLLHWSRVQLGKMPFRPEVLNMHNKVSECFELQYINANAKNIILKNEISDSDFVWADSDMISLVLRNLVSNAVKFTPRGGFVTVSSTKISENLLAITIADTGVGLTDEEKTKLFRLDVNFTTSGTDNEPGTGLGLILCKECIERHGGTIKVESIYTQGCQFIFTLNTSQNV